MEVATYDGDTPTAARQLARQKARVLLTNPDMIHVSLLPRHERWDDFFYNLRYVVIDEAHTYRGVFGSNVANVLRRLRRVASFYGAEPRFILASATIRNAREHAAATSPGWRSRTSAATAPRSGARKIVFWQPPLVEDELNVRRSSNTEAADLLAELVRNGVRSICFTKSRRTRRAHLPADRQTGSRRPTAVWPTASLPTAPATRPSSAGASRQCSSAGELLAVVSTSALELGIDIGALDAAITVGYPGHHGQPVAAVGPRRPGKGREPGRSSWPATTPSSSSSSTTRTSCWSARWRRPPSISPTRSSTCDHLAAAAYEGPLDGRRRPVLRARDSPPLSSGRPSRGPAAPQERVPGSSRGSGFPAAKIGLRSTAGEQYTIVEEETGDIVGTEGAETAFSALHPGAVYLHMGDTYLVTELDLDGRVALVRPFWDTYHTLPRRETDTRILSETLRTSHGPLSLHLGEIAVSSRVVAFQKKRLGSDEVLGTEELDLPAQEFVTEAMWFTIPAELFPSEAELVRLPGAIHAVEHALIALLPALRHVRPLGHRRAFHAGPSPDREPTIFIYDGHAGGVGISRQGFERFPEWVRDA